MPTALRLAAPDDREVIADIWHASASLPGVGPVPMPSRDALRERLEKGFESGWQVTLAVRDGERIGFLAIKRAEAVLSELFIRPDRLGGGVGLELLRHAKTQMPDGFRLYTRSSNLRACQFYVRNGLRETLQGFHPRSGDPITHYCWKSHVSAAVATLPE